MAKVTRMENGEYKIELLDGRVVYIKADNLTEACRICRERYL